jgi:outer membrane lipoprotein-sorting protein
MDIRMLLKKMTLSVIFCFSVYAGVLLADEQSNLTPKVALSHIKQAMSKVEEIRANFVQEKHLSLFEHTLIISGNLEIKFPHYFKWVVSSPLKSEIIADGDTVTTWDEETDQKVTMSVKSNPVIKNIWTQIDSWFLGKYDILAKSYAISIKSDKPLVLTFVPKSKPLSAAVKKITVYFREDKKYLQKVILEEVGGDSTVMKFSNIKIKESL